MYLADVTRGAGLRGGSLRRVATGNVLALGVVSLLTDVSAEMVTAVLPAYLVLGLHLSIAQYGALDGLYTGATALTRLVGGYLADRFRRRKLVALVGYGLSALAKVGLLGASGAVGVGAVIAADRTGKGLRTAPRDALIATSVPERDLGQAFGVHRAMDAVGAFLGPVAALALLALAGTTDYSVVFVGSLCAGLLGLVVLALFVREPAAAATLDPAPGAEPVLSAPGRLRARELLRAGAFRRLCLVAALLGLVTVGDGFVYLVLQDRDDLPVRVFPLLAVGTSLAFLLLAVPLGRLADRVGRWPVVVGGYACLLGVYLLLSTDAGPLWLVLALYGAFYAATDGVLSALAVPLLPEALRTTGLALLQTGQALAYVVSSVVFGLLWQHAGVAVACLTAAAVAVLLLPACAVLLRATGRAR